MEQSPSGQTQMQSDDSQLVDQLLTELNSSMDNMNQAPNVQMTATPIIPAVPIPPNIQMETNMGAMMATPSGGTPLSQIKELPANVVVEFNSNDGKITKLVKMVRLPFIVFGLCFLLFNPLTSSLLSRYFPTLFGFPSTTLRGQLRVAMLSLIVACVYAVVHFFIR